MKSIIFNSFLLILFISMPLISLAQDTLRLLNGKVMDVSIQDLNERSITFVETFKGKASFRERQLNTIFSYQEFNKPEVIVYEYQPESGNFYQIDEMRNYILGEQHADSAYSSAFLNSISVLTGVSAGYFLAQGDLAFVAFPIVYSSILIIPGAKVKKRPYNSAYMNDDAYLAGYKRVARSKKFFNCLAISGVSMLASFGVFKIIDN
ncbi:MAG TPA: hypothetical protein V6C96_00255 [Vampirovibrionales bacterium]